MHRGPFEEWEKGTKIAHGQHRSGPDGSSWRVDLDRAMSEIDLYQDGSGQLDENGERDGAAPDKMRSGPARPEANQ